MDTPPRFGHTDVTWAPSTNHDPKQVVAAWLQHGVVLAIRQHVGAMSVREMATRAGVNKSTMGRWLAGQEALTLPALGTLAAAFGVDILDALAVDGDDPVNLLPPPYRPLVRREAGQITFDEPDEPAWVQLAAAVAATVADAQADGSVHLLTASALAWAFARSAHSLAPTRDLVDLDPTDASIVTLGLDTPISVAITFIIDGSAALTRSSILRALSAPREAGTETRPVSALTLGPRGVRILAQVLTRIDEHSAIISATTLARVGLGDPVDPDVSVVELANVDAGAGAGRVVLLEITKLQGD